MPKTGVNKQTEQWANRVAVMRCRTLGMSVAETAKHLGIDPRTVQTHTAAIRQDTEIKRGDYQALFDECFEKLQMYERLALEKNSLRIAMEATMNQAKLMGMIERRVTVTGDVQHDVRQRIEIVRPDRPDAVVVEDNTGMIVDEPEFMRLPPPHVIEHG